jgi:hypothetical protein
VSDRPDPGALVRALGLLPRDSRRPLREDEGIEVRLAALEAGYENTEEALLDLARELAQRDRLAALTPEKLRELLDEGARLRAEFHRRVAVPMERPPRDVDPGDRSGLRDLARRESQPAVFEPAAPVHLTPAGMDALADEGDEMARRIGERMRRLDATGPGADVPCRGRGHR